MTPLRRRSLLLLAALAAVGAALVVAASWGGAVSGRVLAGLPDAGPLTAWGLPATRAVADLAAALTIGWCVTAAFLLPGTRSPTGELLGAAGYRLVRAAAWWAALWSVASLSLLVFTLSDLLGRPLADVTFTGVRSLAFSIPQGRSAVVQAVLAAGVAVACRLVLTRTGAGVVAGVACVAALPPALTGHAAGAGNHQLAVTSLAVHILAAAVWVGGLIGIDPGRRAVAPPILVVLHFAGMAFHAFLGVILFQAQAVIAADWYRTVHPDPAFDLLADQRLAAGIAWAFGEAPAVVILALLVARWIRADEREQRRLDRAADRAEANGEEDDLARYNDFLRRAAAAVGDRGGDRGGGR